MIFRHFNNIANSFQIMSMKYTLALVTTFLIVGPLITSAAHSANGNVSYISWSNNNQSISHGNHSNWPVVSAPAWNVSHPLNGSHASHNNSGPHWSVNNNSIHLNTSGLSSANGSSISWPIGNRNQTVAQGNHSNWTTVPAPAWNVSHPLNSSHQPSWVGNNNSTNNSSAIWQPAVQSLRQSIWSWLTNWRNSSRPTIGHRPWLNRTAIAIN